LSPASNKSISTIEKAPIKNCGSDPACMRAYEPLAEADSRQKPRVLACPR
jgi:hypothetical protein